MTEFEKWVRPKKFKLVTDPVKGKYVYHRSPSGRKKTLGVPNTVMTKNNAVAWLAKHMIARPTGARATMTKNEVDLGCGSLKYMTGVREIGAGRQGVILAATRGPLFIDRDLAIKVTPFDKSAEARGEKQPALVENDIHTACQRVGRPGVIRIMGFVKECRDFIPVSYLNSIKNSKKDVDQHRQFVFFLQRADNGTLMSWLKSKVRTLTDTKILSVIRQVLITLEKITDAYPEFRHNDLHLDNILMLGDDPKISDFGWARLKKTGTNPAVNTAAANGVVSGMYGIGPETDARYDSHMFLRDMLNVTSKIPQLVQTRKFLERSVPLGYREMNDTYTREGRLKYRGAHPLLPTLKKILKDPLMSPSPVARRVSPVARRVSRARRVSPARRVSHVNFLTMTPKTFMKLSPATRARAIAARKGRVSPKKKSPPVARRASPATAARRASPAAAVQRISPGTLRSKKFQDLVNSLMPPPPNMNAYYAKSPSRRGPPPVNNYYGRRNIARARAINILERRRLVLGEKSPGTGRVKIMGPTGRMVYADGQTMAYLRSLANRAGINASRLKTKAEIAESLLRV